MVSRPAPRLAVAGLAAAAAAHATVQIGVLGLSAMGGPVGAAQAYGILAIALVAALVAARLCSSPSSTIVTPSNGAWKALPFVLAGLIVWAATLALATRRPVYDWDGLYYHLPAIDAWVRAGRVHWITSVPDVPFVNGYPMATEVFDFLVVQLTGVSRWLDAGNLAFWPLGAMGLVLIAASLGARPAVAWSTGAGLAGIPMLVAQSATAYVDAAHACCAMATLGAATLLLDRCELRRALLLGLCAGLTLATKGTGLLLVGVLSLTLLFALRRRRVRWRSLAAAAAVIATTALAVGGAWFVRNVLHTGNPLYPVQVSMLGHVLWPGVDARAHTLLNLPAWLAPWPAFLRPLVSWIQPDAPVAGYGAISGLGFSWLLGGLPASLVLAAWVLRRRRVPIAMPWLLVTATLVLALQPAPWWGRFTLWLHALGLPAVAVLMQAAWDAPRRVPAALAALWLVVLVGVASWETSVVLRRGAADGRGADGIYADSIDYVFPELRATAPPAWHARCLARSRWGRWGTLLGGGLAQPAGARRIQVVDADVAPEALVRDGIRWVLWDVAGAGAPPRALLDAAVERHDYAPSQDLYFVLLELGEPAGVPSR